MKKIPSVFFALLLSFCLAQVAGAAYITYDYDLDGDGLPTTSVLGAVVWDFNDGSATGPAPFDSVTGDYAIVQGSVPNLYKAPGDDNETYYLTVPYETNSGSAEFNLLYPANYFGLYWGSIDRYNTLSFRINNSWVGFTGEDVNGGGTFGETPQYVNFFFEDSYFDGILMSSTNYAFEVDNMAVAQVPEPGLILLIGTGLLGLIGLGRKRLGVKA